MKIESEYATWATWYVNSYLSHLGDITCPAPLPTMRKMEKRHSTYEGDALFLILLYMWTS